MNIGEKQGSVLGGVLLIAGSCIGSGMLALPILTGLIGFFPAMLMFVLAWGFMTVTALYLVEVNSWFKERVNFITMVSKTLGPYGKLICWMTYLLLFYSLLVAYISMSGQHFSEVLELFSGRHLPNMLASIFFVLIFGWLVLMGTRQVDLFNRWLMFVKIGAFVVLTVVGLSYIKPDKLLHTDFTYSFFALPVLVVSFGFQNMIPSLNHYLGGDTRRVRWAIIGGSLFTLGIYVIWEVVALGILSVDGPTGILTSYHDGIDAAKAIKGTVHSHTIGLSAQLLALFAILTSFLAQSLSLAHFLGDGVKAKNKDSIGLVALALLPPLVLEIMFPNIFYQALNFAGGICAVVLFGLLPVLMVWKGRYIIGHSSELPVKGGKGLILIVGLFAAFIFFYQLTVMLKIPLFPHP